MVRCSVLGCKSDSEQKLPDLSFHSVKMDKRQQELTELKDFVANIDNESTLLLQNLQWDQTHLIKSTQMVICKYVDSHRIPMETREAHEKQCYLTQQGYSKEDVLLPDPVDPEASTIVKLSKQDIMQIIQTAAASDPLFKKGVPCPGPEPLSAERLQLVYSADERRAIHAAVAAAAPARARLPDLALAGSSAGPQTSKKKSNAETLAELRDMKRRPTKYRVAAKTQNYSDVMRDVIKIQMELCTDPKVAGIKTESGSKNNTLSLRNSTGVTETDDISTHIKLERISPESDNHSNASSKLGESSKSRYVNIKRKHDDREPSSKNKRDKNQGSSSRKERYRDSRHDRYKYASKERNRYDGPMTRSIRHENADNNEENAVKERDNRVKTKQDKDIPKHRNQHSKINEDDALRDKSILDDERKDSQNNNSKDSQKYGDRRRNYVIAESTNNRNIKPHRTDNSASSSNDRFKQDRSHKADSTSIQYDLNKKLQEQYQRMHEAADRYRAHKQRQRYGYKLKEVKHDA